MPEGATTVGMGLAPVYAVALAQPELVGDAASSYLRLPEAAEVLDGALETLWRSILAPDEADPASSPLDPAQKSWLLLHAGLLRGFNLALIAAWRPSGDSLPALDALYPGFLAYGEALYASTARTSPGLTPSTEDSRRVVDRVAAEARRLLRLGLERGYGLGFLVDAALDAARAGSLEPSSAGLAACLRPAVGAGAPDDPALLAAASGLADRLGRTGRHRALGDLPPGAASRVALEVAVAEQSRARPLSVPANIGRFSAPYVCTMLAYLLRWWLAVGLRLGLRERLGLPALPSESLAWERYPVRRWLADQAHRWAREETPEILAAASQPAYLRWRLADLAQTMAAVGWRLALALDEGR